jgi:hypothetical protein
LAGCRRLGPGRSQKVVPQAGYRIQRLGQITEGCTVGRLQEALAIGGYKRLRPWQVTGGCPFWQVTEAALLASYRRLCGVCAPITGKALFTSSRSRA